jgi:uncharacterized membrane protein YkvA (DUF1232 family)
LAIPFDIIPDWVPVLGYLDDVFLIIITLRSIIARVPSTILDEHWKGEIPLTDVLRRLSFQRKKAQREDPGERA